jgi:hypothetical protein
VRYLAGEAGIRQFLNLGTGIPTAGNTHQVAQEIAPESRVVYVDYDPVVLAHARALLTSSQTGATDYIHADVRDTGTVLAQASHLLDLARPSGWPHCGSAQCCIFSVAIPGVLAQQPGQPGQVPAVEDVAAFDFQPEPRAAGEPVLAGHRQMRRRQDDPVTHGPDPGGRLGVTVLGGVRHRPSRLPRHHGRDAAHAP